MKLLSDAALPSVVVTPPDPWILVAVIAAVLAVSAVLIVVLVTRKKNRKS